MANNFDSNFTRKLMEKVLASVETNRVISKDVNTQLFKGSFNPSTGSQIDVQRPTDYRTTRTASGDISGSKEDIITGKATATVQDYITVAVDYNEADEALKMGNNSSRFWDDIAMRIVTDLEVDFARYALNNSNLLAGTYGTPADAWNDIGDAYAIMSETGVPVDNNWCYAMSAFNMNGLASDYRSLGVNPEVGDASEKGLITRMASGFKVKTATALNSLTLAGADRVGALSANPDVTYVTHKDTMQQTLPVNGFTANLAIKAGEMVKITGRNRLNLSTKQTLVNKAGAVVEFTATVAQDVTLDGTGAGNIVISGPAIYEATGAYNTVDSAPVSGDVVTLLGSAGDVVRPNLFFHRDAFAIAFVNMHKLHSTDTIATTKDGLQMRVSKYADGDANKQTVRIDLRPAYATLNPFFAGQGFGS